MKSQSCEFKVLDNVEKINLRGPAEDEQFIEQMKSTLGLNLPEAVGDVCQNDQGRLMALGPDEWLYVADDPDHSVYDSCWQLKETLKGNNVLVGVVDVTDAWNVVLFEGHPMRLNHYSPIHFDISVFPVGTVVQTKFAHIGVTIYRLDDEKFELYVHPSMKKYLTDLLTRVNEFHNA